MSRDIRSFFTVISKKSKDDSKNEKPPPNKPKTKRLIDSDDEDVIPETPKQKQSSTKKQKIAALSSDSEDEASKAKTKSINKPETTKLKPVNVSDVFTETPIKQTKVEVISKPEITEEKETKTKKSKSKKKKQQNTELGIHDDKSFEQTLLDLDDGNDDVFAENLELLDKEVEAVNNTDKKENVNSNSSPVKSERKRSRNDSPNDKSTPKKKKIEHTDSGIDPGQESYEKKRYSAMLYQKYLNRSGPKHHGMKKLPKGKPDCLKNLCFLRTGVLDSLDSDEFDKLIKEHGGRVVHAVSKKVNYIVVGDEPGPAKLAKAESYNIPNISEDELLDLILVKSGMEAEYCKKNTSVMSEDIGIESDDQIKSSEDFESTDLKVDVKESKDDVLKTEDQKKEKKSPPEDKPSTSKTVDRVETAPTVKSKAEIDPMALSLTDKYKPKDLKGIIGQQSEDSNMNKLKRWLKNWYRNQDPAVKKTLTRPSPWARNDDGAYFKCALLSGPPGVGKTTTATLVAKDLGMDIVELNASDTRNKRLLHEEVSQLLKTNTIAGFAAGQSIVNKNRVLLMDEVDGMAGNEDRGGMQELIQLIKHSSIPIICVCNDRNHQKIKSLVNYCFDLRFTKPKLEQIRGAMMSICFKEGLNIKPNVLSEVIIGTGCDVRQTLNYLALWAATEKNVPLGESEKESNTFKKDTIMGPWEVCRTVFTESEHKNMSIADKAKLFFFDYSIGPLFVQENYLKVQPKNADKKMTLKRATLAADSISRADLIDSKIRRTNNWSLLESEAIFASVLPGYYMSGNFTTQINFPSWLGKNSKKNKFNRLFGEIQAHIRTSTFASKMAVKLDYLVPLRDAILLPLKEGMEGLNEAVDVMKTYNLLREDFDSLLELSHWRGDANPTSGIDTKVKAAFTRTYNKQVTLLPYAPTSGISKKKAAAEKNDLLGEEEEEIIESDNEDDLDNNAMIKVKKPAGKKKTNEAGTSKKGETKKGKGKKTK